jgi:hypothetical protein
VAAALRELGAYLRVAGLSDEEARALPAQLDGYSLARIEISTWRTDAGDLDILVNIPGADGRRRRYEDLVDAATIVQGTGFAIRAAALKDIIASKQWADRPKDREALPELHHLAAARSEATPGGTGDVVDEQARLTHGDNPDLSAQPGTELGRGTGPAPANEPDSPGLG